MSAILHPELINTVPLVGNQLTSTFNKLADDAAVKPVPGEGISVVARSLNEAAQVGCLIEDINAQKFSNDVEIILVDNESSDGTPEIAKALGVTVVNLARNEFTYPRSMNLGVDAASHEIVWLTVAHALPVTNRLLHGGATNFLDEKVAGAFATPTLPSSNASFPERLLGILTPIEIGQSKKVVKAQLGTMAATSAMLRKSIWKELGRFDERFEAGGEDTALGAKMLEAGYDLNREPLLSVHHSHGLGVVGNIKQVRGWMQTVRGPVKLEKDKLFANRPHLDFDQ